ncbi:flavin reductase family protein [Victivallis sp. Marseille-Q1083]|uniref:flavin reductase family protein n=1 Tax=Victivallis sp. Marseille-Q1083 TaxID=2717288 RepID=UPI00158E44E6|nr:flavin reductase family protein [Victivallis sp. Marseille-Q1083]
MKTPSSPANRFRKVVWPGSTQLAPVPPVLVACAGPDGGRPNLLTIAWTGILCSRPPMLSIAVRPERYSYPLLEASGEFSVNLPTPQLAKAVDWCGVVSGRDHDKFRESGLTPLPASRIQAPIVAECVVALECRIVQKLTPGIHHLFLAEIVAVQVSEHLIASDGKLQIDRDGLLAYAHGHYYELGRCLGHFGFSVRRKAGPLIRQ